MAERSVERDVIENFQRSADEDRRRQGQMLHDGAAKQRTDGPSRIARDVRHAARVGSG